MIIGWVASKRNDSFFHKAYVFLQGMSANNSGTSSNRSPFIQHPWGNEGDDQGPSSLLLSWSRRWLIYLSQVHQKQQWYQHCEHTPTLHWRQCLRQLLVHVVTTLLNCKLIIYSTYFFMWVPLCLVLRTAIVFWALHYSAHTLAEVTLSSLTYIMWTLFQLMTLGVRWVPCSCHPWPKKSLQDSLWFSPTLFQESLPLAWHHLSQVKSKPWVVP